MGQGALSKPAVQSVYCVAIRDSLGAGERGGFLWRMW